MLRNIPGGELPAAIYRSVVLAFAWLVLAAWIGFGHQGGTDVDLVLVSVIFFIVLMLPTLVRKTASRHRLQAPNYFQRESRSDQIDTATGWLPAGEVWLQILLIPVALAMAATMFATVYYLVG